MRIGDGLILLGCYALGVFTSYSFFKNKYRKEKEDEIESVKEHLKKYYNDKYGVKSDEEDLEDKKEAENLGLKGSKSTVEMFRPDNTVPKTNYSKYSKQDYIDLANSEFPREDDEDDDDLEFDEPFEITIDEYLTRKGFSKNVFGWYTEDDVLANEGDRGPEDPELIDDEKNLLGNVLDTSGFKKNDVPVIYIRNPQLSADYEVTKYFGSYS